MPVDADSRFELLRIEEKPHLPHVPGKVGLQPTKTVLFMGDSGVGKTLAARWLAYELKLLLLTLGLSAVMSSYLGCTGSNLRHVLDFAKNTDYVLLLDELNAVAKRRDDKGEIGELKRLVTVLLQQLDNWPSSILFPSQITFRCRNGCHWQQTY